MKKDAVVRAIMSLLVAACVALSGVHPATQQTARAEATSPVARSTVRVGMWTLWRDREVSVAPAGVAGRTLMRTCEQCAAGSLREKAILRAEGDAITLTMGGKTTHLYGAGFTGPVTLAAHGESVTLHNPVAISARAGVLTIAVTMPVESYVERVVESESGAADSAESLKALAIVARSFALHEAHGHAEYDLCDSTHCQLLHWNGRSERRAAAHAAVLATAGETLWFRGQRALAYFGKDCGGQTATPSEIWPRAKPVPYLPSRPDHNCTGDGGGGWASEITHADLTAALAAHKLAAPGWQNLTVARRGESGRVVTVRLDRREVDAEEFRLAVGESLGWSRIPSTWFEVSRQGDLFEFHGRGWGHGVGMCQKGAAAMAARGHTEREILEQYFPGAEAADEATGRAWKSFVGSGFVLVSLDGADGAFVADLNRARAEATQRSGLNSSSQFTVRAFASTAAFREATLAPGWVAAFDEGGWIGTQPLRTLAARHLLAGTMRHEFLHALVEERAGPNAPLWLREGLVEVWSEAGSPANGAPGRPTMKPDVLDAALAHASSEVESEAAHRAAEWFAAQLLTRYGREQALDWLRSGLPAGVVAALGQR